MPSAVYHAFTMSSLTRYPKAPEKLGSFSPGFIHTRIFLHNGAVIALSKRKTDRIFPRC